MNGFWHPVTALKNNLKFYDVYELLSEFLQQKLNIFKDFALDVAQFHPDEVQFADQKLLAIELRPCRSATFLA